MVVHQYAAQIQQSVAEDTLDSIFGAEYLVYLAVLLRAVEYAGQTRIYGGCGTAGLCHCNIEHSFVLLNYLYGKILI